MLKVASTVAASPEEVSITAEESLTPAQKAARTRAANKARREAELAAAAAAE